MVHRLIGAAAWRIELKSAISARRAKMACLFAAYHPNLSAMGLTSAPPPYTPLIRQCDCGILGPGWRCPTCEADEYYY